MKKLISIFLSFLILSHANANVQNKRYELELTNPDKPMSLSVDMRNGSIDVEGYDGKTVEIVASFTPLSKEDLMDQNKSRKHSQRESTRQQARQQTSRTNGEPEEKQPRSKEGLKVVNNQLMNLEIREKNNRVRINSEHSTFFTSVTVRVPSTANIEIELYQGGEIKVANVSGSVELESWRANVTAHSISGPIVAETHQSDIEVVFSSFNGEHPTSLTTYSGDIDVTVAKSMAANMNVQNYQGQILSGIEEAFITNESVQQSEGSKSKEIIIGGQMTAKLNGGGQEVSLITYSGDVYIRN